MNWIIIFLLSISPRSLKIDVCHINGLKKTGLRKTDIYQTGQPWGYTNHRKVMCICQCLATTQKDKKPAKLSVYAGWIVNYWRWLLTTWCPGPESNRHAPYSGKRRILSPLCLPISPPGQHWSIWWRRGPESNRRRRLCKPLHNHFATPPMWLGMRFAF